MEFIVNNWYMILATVVLLASAIYIVVKFFRQPSSEQVRKVKQWLLIAVIEAEKQFGGGTGTVKLHKVYDLFVARWPWVAKVVPFELFSTWVDEALAEMRELLEKNLAVAAYVYGTEDGVNVDDLSDSQLRALLEEMGVVGLNDGPMTREEMMELLDQVETE